jgi:hypothetical protein
MREHQAMTLTHADLCELASTWLRKPNNRGGHGCQVAFTETRIGVQGGESPDALGFRAAGWIDGSVLVECKTSRTDFLADAKKPHRLEGKGMGRWRYYMCPEGLINPDELPARWGLLYVDSKRRIRAVAGAVCALACNTADGINRYRDEAMSWTFANDVERELKLLTHLLFRVGDAERLNLELRKAKGEAQQYANMYNQVNRQLHEERAQRWQDRATGCATSRQPQ